MNGLPYVKLQADDDCLAYIEEVLWAGQPKCPYCHSANFTHVRNQRRYHCNACNYSYSVTVSTFLHKTRVSLKKWFFAVFLLLESDVSGNRISSRQLSKAIEVHKNTAWLMITRINQAMRHPQQRQLIQAIADNERQNS